MTSAVDGLSTPCRIYNDGRRIHHSRVRLRLSAFSDTIQFLGVPVEHASALKLLVLCEKDTFTGPVTCFL